MATRAIAFLFLVTSMCAVATADEKYVLHENLHVGQKVPFVMSYVCKVKSTSTTGSKQTVTNTETGQFWNVTLNMLAVKDGSDMRSEAYISPDSYNTSKTGNAEKTKTPCPFAGKTIILRRHEDESFTNDFQGDAETDDVNMLNNFLSPDADFYPDDPVAVGDTWDNSAKMALHAQLGPKDQLASRCRLDWVKVIDGKKMAQVTNSAAIIFHEEGNVEEDMSYSTTFLIDIAAGMIVKCDQKGSSQYSTPATEATRVSGGTEFTYHDEVPAGATAGATTKP